MSGGDVLGVFDLLHRAREGAPAHPLGLSDALADAACGRGSLRTAVTAINTKGCIPAWAGEPRVGRLP